MKKKYRIGLIAVLFMLLMLSGFAENADAWKENTGVIDLTERTATGQGAVWEENILYITVGGDFSVSGTLPDGMICVDTDDRVKLRLQGASVTNPHGPAIYFKNTDKSFITIVEGTQNYLADGAAYTEETADAPLFSANDLEIKGSGTLTVCGSFKHGIAGSDDIKIENGSMIITAKEHGIKASGTISVLGGNLDIKAQTGKGMKAEQALSIEGGTLNVVSEQSEGIESKGPLSISGGDICVTAKDDGLNTGAENNMDRGFGERMPGMREEGGFRGKMPTDGAFPMPEGEMPRGDRAALFGDRAEDKLPPMLPEGELPPAMPEGEMPPMMPPEDLLAPQTAETDVDHTITISGGNIYINAEGDGIDSNGALFITGGTIVIDGPQNNGNGALDAQAGITTEDGTITIVSAAGMLQLPQDKDMLRASFTDGKAGDVLVLLDASGKELFSHTAVKAYDIFVYIRNDLDAASTYFLHRNGEAYAEIKPSQSTFSDGFGGMPGWGQRGMKNKGMRPKNEITVLLDGEKVVFNTSPYIKNDTTLVGFRAILERLGATVSWNEQTRQVTAEKDNMRILLTIDSHIAYVNEEAHTLLAAPEITNGSTMIPVRFVSEQLGLSVEWNEAFRQVEITTK